MLIAPGPEEPRRRRRQLRRLRWKIWLRPLGGIAHLLPAALTGTLAIKGLHPELPGWPCPLRELTGIPCPTCYLTRATSQALVGHLDQAIQLHAFGPLLAAGLLIWSLTSWRSGRLQPWPTQARWPAPLAVGAAASLLLYWLLRLWNHSTGLASPLAGLAFPGG